MVHHDSIHVEICSLYGMEWCESLETLSLFHGSFQVAHLSNLNLKKLRISGRSINHQNTPWKLEHFNLKTLIELSIDESNISLLTPEIFPTLALKTLTAELYNEQRIITEDIQRYLNYLLEKTRDPVGVIYGDDQIQVLTNPSCGFIFSLQDEQNNGSYLGIKIVGDMVHIGKTKKTLYYNYEVNDIGTLNITETILQELADLLKNNIEPAERIRITISNHSLEEFIIPDLRFLNDIAESVIGISLSERIKIQSLEGIELCRNLEAFNSADYLDLHGLEKCPNLKTLSIDLNNHEITHLRNLPLQTLKLRNVKTAENLQNLISNDLLSLELDEKNSQFLPEIILPANSHLGRIIINFSTYVRVPISDALIKFLNLHSSRLQKDYHLAYQDESLIISIGLGMYHDDYNPRMCHNDDILDRFM
jgi:hypothetical protein